MEDTQKQETMRTGIGNDEEAMLPEGWAEGDNIFDVDSWSGKAEQSGQTDEAADTKTTTESGDGSQNSDAPTTGEMSESAADQGPAQEAQEEPSGQTEKPAQTARQLKLKVNHKEETVDINAMSDEDLAAALQKARAFDAQQEAQRKQTYRTTYDKLVNDDGMPEEVARMAAAEAAGGRHYSLDAETDTARDADASAEAQQGSAPAAAQRDIVSEMATLKALYPDFREMPDAVAVEISNGKDAVQAYVAWRSQQAEAENARVRKENQTLKENAARAARAPVTGVTGGAKAQPSRSAFEESFLKGFDADKW